MIEAGLIKIQHMLPSPVLKIWGMDADIKRCRLGGNRTSMTRILAAAFIFWSFVFLFGCSIGTGGVNVANVYESDPKLFSGREISQVPTLRQVSSRVSPLAEVSSGFFRLTTARLSLGSVYEDESVDLDYLDRRIPRTYEDASLQELAAVRR